MVWDWRFIDEGDHLAVLIGPVHGEAAEARLYDTHKAHVLAKWEGKGAVPTWAGAWENKFEERRQK